MALFQALKNVQYDNGNTNAVCSFQSNPGPNNHQGTCCKKGDLNTFYNQRTHDCCSNGDIASKAEC